MNYEFILALVAILAWPLTIIGIILWVRKQIYKDKK